MNTLSITPIDIDSRHPLAAIAEIQKAYDAIPDDLKAGAVLFTGNHELDGDRGPTVYFGSTTPLDFEGGTALISRNVWPRSRY